MLETHLMPAPQARTAAGCRRHTGARVHPAVWLPPAAPRPMPRTLPRLGTCDAGAQLTWQCERSTQALPAGESVRSAATCSAAPSAAALKQHGTLLPVLHRSFLCQGSAWMHITRTAAARSAKPSTMAFTLARKH